MKKFIVITSIFPPAEAVTKFAKKKEWQLIVVGDKKTPLEWEHKNVMYVSPKDQVAMYPEFTKMLPWNSYCRKMIGYLYAMQQGAEVIADTDDDNIPYEGWGEGITYEGVFPTVSTTGFANMYSFFTNEHIWPRGFPLNKILEKKKYKKAKKQQKIGIWQFLADGDPDVDAIYRLANNKEVYFQKNSRVVLNKGTLCPFNSQNTFILRQFFPLLYLPAFVTFRYTDILRGLIAQPLLWSAGYKLGFGEATVIQKRNPHDYLKDFESEIPCYLYPEKVIDIATKVIDPTFSIGKNMLRVYTNLYKENIVEKREIELLRIWLRLVE